MAEHHFLSQVLLVLLAALVAVPLFQKLRFGSVLGYLVAGAMIGPDGLALVDNLDAITLLGEFGVVFLLFTIGLELTVDRLKAIGGRTYGLGSAQILVTALAFGLIVAAFGYSANAAVIVGGGLALSSTAIVLQVLADRGQLNTGFGRTVLAILLLQDLAVGPLLVLVEVLDPSHNQGAIWSELGLAAIKAAVAIIAILIAGHFLLRPCFRIIVGARSPELFAAATLMVALGTSWLTEIAGLSMAFGAFLAGLLMAETEYRHQVKADIEPFRGLLLGLFFMAVGMGIDLDLALDQAGKVTLFALIIVVVKAAVLIGLVRMVGLSIWRGIRLGAHLAQGGEFAFVLFGAAMISGLLPADLGQPLVVAVAFSMAVTPLIATYGSRLLALAESREAAQAGPTELAQHAGELENHVILAGFGDVGRIVARMLKAHGIPYLILDRAPQRVLEARREGEPIYYGDAALVSVLAAAGAEHARAIVVATEREDVALHMVEAVRDTFPTLRIVARGGNEAAAMRLRREAGICDVISETMETGLRLVGAVVNPKT